LTTSTILMRDVAPPAVTVRRADAADSDALAALRRAWVEEDGPAPDPTFETRFAWWLNQEGDRRISWVATTPDRAVGMLNLAVFTRMPKPGTPPQRWGYIANVFVLTEHRNFGVGQALLDAAIDYAREERFVRLVLNPSTRSIPFYRRAGFVPSPLYWLELAH
jgi:GNAT superfamily N-acetyltransferase